MADRRSDVPDFTLLGVTWQCWITGDGKCTWYEWRSACGQFAVWRDGGWRARRGNVVGRYKHTRLIEAMWAAQKEQHRRAAA